MTAILEIAFVQSNTKQNTYLYCIFDIDCAHLIFFENRSYYKYKD